MTDIDPVAYLTAMDTKRMLSHRQTTRMLALRYQGEAADAAAYARSQLDHLLLIDAELERRAKCSTCGATAGKSCDAGLHG